nr:substrate binding domain-containing protein [Chelatococcus sp. YT9]
MLDQRLFVLDSERYDAFMHALRVKLWLSEEPREVIENKIDVAIRLGNLDGPLLSVRKLAAGNPRILFASPEYLAHQPPIREPEDLLHHNCLTWPLDGRFENGSAIWKVRTNGVVRELRVSGSFQANSNDMIRRAALAGLGVGLLPEWTCDEDIRAGRLVAILRGLEITPTTFDHNIYAVFQRSVYMPLKVRLLIDHLVAYGRTLKI